MQPFSRSRRFFDSFKHFSTFFDQPLHSKVKVLQEHLVFELQSDNQFFIFFRCFTSSVMILFKIKAQRSAQIWHPNYVHANSTTSSDWLANCVSQLLVSSSASQSVKLVEASQLMPSCVPQHKWSRRLQFSMSVGESSRYVITELRHRKIHRRADFHHLAEGVVVLLHRQAWNKLYILNQCK